MKDPKLELASYRLKRAHETMEEAVALIQQIKSNGAINRIYYSIFYATRALLATMGIGRRQAQRCNFTLSKGIRENKAYIC